MRSEKGKKKDEEPGRERLKRELIEQREAGPPESPLQNGGGFLQSLLSNIF